MISLENAQTFLALTDQPSSLWASSPCDPSLRLPTGLLFSFPRLITIAITSKPATTMRITAAVRIIPLAVMTYPLLFCLFPRQPFFPLFQREALAGPPGCFLQGSRWSLLFSRSQAPLLVVRSGRFVLARRTAFVARRLLLFLPDLS